MKNLLILYNVVFLLVGNVLFSNIHYMNDHNHSHNHNNEISECYECIMIEKNNNYAIDFQEINFSNYNFNFFNYEYDSFIEFNIKQTYSSRAPPIS